MASLQTSSGPLSFEIPSLTIFSILRSLITQLHPGHLITGICRQYLLYNECRDRLQVRLELRRGREELCRLSSFFSDLENLMFEISLAVIFIAHLQISNAINFMFDICSF